MKRIVINICLIVAFIAATSESVHAVKARPGVITVTQPDGTTLNVRLIGDEHFHYYITDDGYPLVNDNDTYYYVKAAPDGKLLRSAMTATAPSLRSTAAREFLYKVDTEATIEALRAVSRCVISCKGRAEGARHTCRIFRLRIFHPRCRELFHVTSQ